MKKKNSFFFLDFLEMSFVTLVQLAETNPEMKSMWGTLKTAVLLLQAPNNQSDTQYYVRRRISQIQYCGARQIYSLL